MESIITFSNTFFLLQDYVIEIQVNSIKLDMKVVFTYDKGSAGVNSTPNDNRTPKDEKVSSLRTFSFYKLYQFN